MTPSETRRLHAAASATGQTVPEVVGRLAARADMWQFIELVLAPDAEEEPTPTE
jgi:hypothetical protein